MPSPDTTSSWRREETQLLLCDLPQACISRVEFRGKRGTKGASKQTHQRPKMSQSVRENSMFPVEQKPLNGGGMSAFLQKIWEVETSMPKPPLGHPTVRSLCGADRSPRFVPMPDMPTME
jgi:hypothetical protein